MNVSVIIPVYNAEKYIAKAIESCFQLEEVKEIIVIDDGYKDAAKQIVQNLALEHKIIKLLEHPNNENRGAGESRNLGIKNSTQDYIAFLDADDFFLPHRFKKDKEVFEKYLDADGCHNAIGTYFYSEKAKKQFQERFASETTTVNASANPSPENLLDGLLGLIENYGYFSLDGYTIKRDFLKKNQLFFHVSSMHEDTVFLIKNSFWGKIYPSELQNPVTLRGVHEENRITANLQSGKLKQLYNRLLMWKELYNWSRNNTLHPRQNTKIYQEYLYFLLKSQNDFSSSYFLKIILKHPKILKHPNYLEFHKLYFGKLRYSGFLYKIRNFAVKFL